MPPGATITFARQMPRFSSHLADEQYEPAALDNHGFVIGLTTPCLPAVGLEIVKWSSIHDEYPQETSSELVGMHTPVCGRCERREYECIYTESRRGYRTHTRNSGLTLSLDDLDPGISPNVSSCQPWDLETSTPRSFIDSNVLSSRLDAQGLTIDNDRMLSCFYKFFYPAHPFVVPLKFYRSHPKVLPQYLTDVMRLMGSQYLHQQSAQPLRTKVLAALSSSLPNNAFSVQALLLFGMFSYARLEQSLGANMIDRAVDLALKIGVNKKQYALQYAWSDPVLHESFWRTWWDLYMVDGLMSAISGSTHLFKLQDITADIPLPGPDELYDQCRPQSTPMQLEDMRNCVFSDVDSSWSSYAYKIEAMQIMSNVLALGTDDFATKQGEVESLDASISNFLLSISGGKAQIAERDEIVDEVLFGAHMIIQWATINLHRPRSSLVFVRNHYPTACTQDATIDMPALEYISHDRKVLRAANAISNLTAIQTPLTAHTPCFACAIALAATVQLPAMTLAVSASEAAGLKERLRLSVSALKSIAEVWPLAQVVKTQIAQFARETFAASHQQDGILNAPSQDAQEIGPLLEPEQSLISDETWLMDLMAST